jgi:hypothetical protein
LLNPNKKSVARANSSIGFQPNKKSVTRANSSIGSRPISASKKHDPTQVQNVVVLLDDSKSKSSANLL